MTMNYQVCQTDTIPTESISSRLTDSRRKRCKGLEVSLPVLPKTRATIPYDPNDATQRRMSKITSGDWDTEYVQRIVDILRTRQAHSQPARRLASSQRDPRSRHQGKRKHLPFHLSISGGPSWPMRRACEDLHAHRASSSVLHRTNPDQRHANNPGSVCRVILAGR
jgi:hypothetical protein